MKIRTMKLMVHVDDYPDMYNSGFVVGICDEGGGEYVKIENGDHCVLNIGPAEWPALRRVINRMIKECKA